MFKLWCIRVPELEEDALLVCNNSGWTTSSILWGLVLYKEKDWATVVERWNPFVETAKKEKITILENHVSFDNIASEASYV